MKLLTLNCHSHIEENYEHKLSVLAKGIAETCPDVIALQEVSQSVNSKILQAVVQEYFPCEKNIAVREDNAVHCLCEQLKAHGKRYYRTWYPIKLGYGRLEEGIAVLSLSPIKRVYRINVSQPESHDNWRRRVILGIKTAECDDAFFSVHFGWWGDDSEPFEKQWNKTLEFLPKRQRVWLMGDFNSPAEIRNEGYDLISGSGFYDTFVIAESKDSGKTAKGSIDGWKNNGITDMRIDGIWTSNCESISVISSRTVFNGTDRETVSDHFGVLAEISDIGGRKQ